ncbi:hypothetical protein BH10BDE1_BH10BDE1_02230 [soil metagenome]
MILRRVLAATLCSLIAFPPQVFAAIGDGFSGNTNNRSTENQPQPIDPNAAAFINDLENGKIESRPVRDADIFHLTGQEVEIFDHGRSVSYDLNQRQVEIPYVAFTALKIVYDKKNRALLFEAFRGMDKEGNNGVLVARQTIKNVDVLTAAEDAELFQFVDSKMKMNAIDLGLVATQIFKAPIPIFQNLWEPTSNETVPRTTAIEGMKSGFLTRGSTPQNLSQAALVPHDQNGQTRLSAGDFYVSYPAANPKSETFAYAIFSRDTTYSQMARGYKILQWQAALLSDNTAIQAQVEQIAEGLQTELDKQELELMNEKVSPQARLVISSLNEASLADLNKREKSMGTLKGNAFDQFTPGEWLKTYNEVSKNVTAETSSKAQEEQWFKFLNKVNAETIDREKKATAQTPKSKLKALRETLLNGTVLKVVGATLGAALVAAPYAYDQFEALQQIKVIAWSYENFFPAVLKDAVYRTPLLLSMGALAALWPEAIAFSAVTAKVLNKMAEKVKSETTRKAIYIKDLARNWGSINNWQRITSFGMRLYAWMILPYWRVLIEHIAQQKTFFSAVNNDLNPMQKLLADSEIGRKLGLTEDQRIGLNQVFGAQKAAKIALNGKIQGAVAQENQKLDSMALLIAATLVAEKHKVDPALIMMLGKDSVQELDVSKITKVLDSPEKMQEWQMLTHLLIKQMSETKKGSIIVDKHLNDLIGQYYEAGDAIVKKLEGMSELRKRFVRLRMGFSSQLSNKLKAAANFAVGDHEFLKRVYTNEFVSDQVNKEFTIDHLMVIGIVGLYGERADLSHPEHLAADAHGFMWTSRAHWYDMFLNTFSHFFLSGASMALVFQKVKPRVAANYAPIEDYQYETREGAQGLWSASKDWLQVFNPIKSDLGGIIIKRFTKRFTTLTAGITMMLLLRVGVWNMGIHNALMAWSFNFITAQWFFGWIWDPVQRGNEMEGERLEEAQTRLKVARRNINRGDLEVGRSELKALYTKYNAKVLKLYDIEKMSKDELLLLSVDQAPVYTKANKWMSWITTWTAAVGSTVMAIPLSVILMDEKLLNAPETWYKWVSISVAAYVGSYFLQAKYVEKYFKYYNDLKAKWAAKKLSKAGAPSEAVTGGSVRSCEALFAPASGI